ncbi:MAG: hypothetical protein OEZ06_06635 [Myxococcales bacterium]|nr:hypothetical protein [Myxococcales bacterium]
MGGRHAGRTRASARLGGLLLGAMLVVPAAAEADFDDLAARLMETLGGAVESASSGSQPSPAPPADDQQIYLYTDQNGRRVYTNVVEQVPLEQRAAARLDLDHVTLNTELGNRLDRRLQKQHAELVETDYCKDVRVAAEIPYYRQLMGRYGPLLVTGGVLLLLLLFTPAAMRRFGAPVWAKVLTTAIPMLGISGLMMFAMVTTNNRIADLKSSATMCQGDRFAHLSGTKNPLTQHMALIHGLRERIAEATEQPDFADPVKNDPSVRELLEQLHQEKQRARERAAREQRL